MNVLWRLMAQGHSKHGLNLRSCHRAGAQDSRLLVRQVYDRAFEPDFALSPVNDHADMIPNAGIDVVDRSR